MILDTNAISALAENNPALVTLLDDGNAHYLAVPTLGEYRFGLLRSRYRKQIGEWLDQLETEFPVLAVDSDTARFYAQIRERLRLLGKPIPVNDLWIAALALQHQQPLLSRDTHFDSVEGIVRVAW